MKTPLISADLRHSSTIFCVRRAICVTAATLMLTATTAHAAVGDGMTTKQFRRWLETSSHATLDHYFAFAERAMKERRFQQAEWAYRHMIGASNGSLERVKLDLSIALIAQGKYLDARDYLEEVLRKGPPPVVQQNIHALLAQVAEQTKPHRISGNLTVGLNSDTNGNSSPGSGQITVVNTDVTLDPAAREQSDLNYYSALAVNHTYRRDSDDRSRVVRWKTDLVGYLAKQDKLDQLDLSMMSIRTGPEMTWLNTGVRAGLYASYAAVTLDGNDYLNSPKGELVVDVPLSGYTTATFISGYEYRDFINSPTITTYDDRTGNAWQQSFGLRHILSDTWAIDGNAFFRQEKADANYFENDQFGGGLGITHLFSPTIVWNSRAGYKFYDYKDADTLISTTVREDTEVSFSTTLSKSFEISGYQSKPTVSAGYLYRDVDSNIQNYEYDNHRLSTSLNIPF